MCCGQSDQKATLFGDHNGESPFAKEVKEGYTAMTMWEKQEYVHEKKKMVMKNDGNNM